MSNGYNPYANLSQYQQQVPQQVQPQPIQPQEPPRQQITAEMQEIAMNTPECKKAYKEWITSRDSLMSRLIIELPEGKEAFNKFQDIVQVSFNSILLETVNNNKNASEFDIMKKKLYDSEKTQSKMQEQIDKLLKEGNKK
jgi:hypothetical protein